MSRYTAYLKRKEKASPSASHAVCRKCTHCEKVRGTAFCNGFGKPKVIPTTIYGSDREGYCTQYLPEEEKENQNGGI